MCWARDYYDNDNTSKTSLFHINKIQIPIEKLRDPSGNALFVDSVQWQNQNQEHHNVPPSTRAHWGHKPREHPADIVELVCSPESEVVEVSEDAI